MSILKEILMKFQIVIIFKSPVVESMVQELFLSYSNGVLPSFKHELWCIVMNA